MSPSRTRLKVMLPTIIVIGTVTAMFLLLIVLGGRVTHGSGTGPAVKFGTPVDTSPNPALFYIKLPLTPRISLNTTGLELGISASTGAKIPAGPPPLSCTSQGANSTPPSLNATDCGAPVTGWYAVLTYSDSVIASVFNGTSSTPEGFVWTPPGVPLESGMDLWLVSDTNLTGNGWSLWAAPSFALSETASVLLV